MSGFVEVIRKDGRILLPVCLGHFLSHFYLFCLAPLFPILHQELGLSYASLGAIITVFSLASGTAQVPMGFIVDRIGAVFILVAGLFFMAGGIGLMGILPSGRFEKFLIEISSLLPLEFSAIYIMLISLAIVAGIGHAVFHPANYVILSSRINQKWVGKAFSLHTFSAQIGNASVPMVMALLVSIFDWRLALNIIGVVGLCMMLWFVFLGRSLSNNHQKADTTEDKEACEPENQLRGWKLLLSAPILMMFYFFFVVAFTSTGVQAFSITAFTEVQGLSTLQSGSALTGFLLASAVGVLAGGVVADQTSKHDLICIVTFSVTAVFMLILGVASLPYLLILLLYVLIGFFQGVLRPARDLMVREVAPKESMGKVFGFVSTGISIGSAVAPILFGWLVDSGRPEWVFFSIAVIMLLGIVSIAATKKSFSPADSKLSLN